MGYNLIIEIQDTQLVIQQQKARQHQVVKRRRWVTLLPEGVVVDGVCKDEVILQNCIRQYQELFGWQGGHVQLIIHSTTIHRWHFVLPRVSKWETKRILRHHHQELTPLSSAYDELSYYTKSQRNRQTVYLVGIPKDVAATYTRCMKALGITQFSLQCGVEARCQGAKKGKDEPFVLVYAIGSTLYGAVSDGFHCLIHKALGQSGSIGWQEAAQRELSRLLYCYTTERMQEPITRLVQDNHPQTTALLQAIGMDETGGILAQEMDLKVVEGTYTRSFQQCECPIPLHKAKVPKGYWLGAGMVGLSCVALLSVGLRTVRWLGYTREVQQLQYTLASPSYQQLQENLIQKEHLQQEVEVFARRQAYIQQPNEHMEASLKYMLETTKRLGKDANRCYIGSQNQRIELSGNTDAPYTLLQWVKELETGLPDYTIHCTFDNANLWQPTAFTIEMMPKEKTND